MAHGTLPILHRVDWPLDFDSAFPNHGRGWSDDEVQHLTRYARDGNNDAQIAWTLGRTPNSIRLAREQHRLPPEPAGSTWSGNTVPTYDRAGGGGRIVRNAPSPLRRRELDLEARDREDLEWALGAEPKKTDRSVQNSHQHNDGREIAPPTNDALDGETHETKKTMSIENAKDATSPTETVIKPVGLEITDTLAEAGKIIAGTTVLNIVTRSVTTLGVKAGFPKFVLEHSVFKGIVKLAAPTVLRVVAQRVPKLRNIKGIDQVLRVTQVAAFTSVGQEVVEEMFGYMEPMFKEIAGVAETVGELAE